MAPPGNGFHLEWNSAKATSAKRASHATAAPSNGRPLSFQPRIFSPLAVLLSKIWKRTFPARLSSRVSCCLG